MYNYDAASEQLQNLTLTSSGGTSYSATVQYNSNGQMTGLDASGTFIEIVETPTTLSVGAGSEQLVFHFNADEQLTRIGTTTDDIVLIIDSNIKGAFHDVNVERIVYAVNQFEFYIIAKQVITSISNFFGGNPVVINTTNA